MLISSSLTALLFPQRKIPTVPARAQPQSFLYVRRTPKILAENAEDVLRFEKEPEEALDNLKRCWRHKFKISNKVICCKIIL